MVVTDQPATGPHSVGGTPAFVVAHGIADHSDLSFELAYELAKLVLEHDGGPVPCTGKGAVMKKPIATALAKQGLIDVFGPRRHAAATKDAVDLVAKHLRTS